MDALLNWLWQGGVVAVALFGSLRLLDRSGANLRYVVCWAALLLVIALPVLAPLASTMPQPDALARISADAIVSVPHDWWTSSELLVLAWAGWASLCVIRFAWAMLGLRRARAHGRMFPAGVEASLPHWRRVRDDGRRPALVLSEAVTSAAVLGGGAPMIAVAPSLVATLEADELDRVLVHEWAHVQRRDDLVSVLQVLLRLVAGWHPAVWWIERRLHVEREIACDEMTIAVTGSARSYAECLVKLATIRGAERTGLPVPAALRASGLRARVTRIVSRRTLIAPAWSRGIAAGVVSVLCVLSLVTGGQQLVEAAALALPFDSVRVPLLGLQSAGLEPIASLRTPPVARQREATPAPLRSVPAAASSQLPADEPPPAPATAVRETSLPSEPVAVDRLEPRAGAHGVADGAVASVPALTIDPPPASPDASVEPGRSPWAAAADTAAITGVAIGRTSKDAGVATAGFFSRLARRVAGSL
jgi:beta-lactamase regulating signal transducer with metallopeptidase domain